MNEVLCLESQGLILLYNALLAINTKYDGYNQREFDELKAMLF